MSIVVFDLETQRSIAEIGGDPKQFFRLGISLGVCLNPDSGTFRTYDEGHILDLVAELIGADLVVGYNIKRFDYEVLKGYTDQPLHSLPTLDLFEEIFLATGKMVSLDNVARNTLGMAKNGHGLQAIEWFKQGEWKKLEDYCKTDVKITFDLYLFAQSQGFLSYFDPQIQTPINVPMRWKHASPLF